jgi:aspartokinase
MLAIDPRVVADAPRREMISFKAAFEMARFGAKVIHPRAVKLGMENNLPIRVRSTFSQSPGTLICDHADTTPLVGFSVVSNAQVAELTGQKLDRKQLDSLEQHVGLLSLTDMSTEKQILCAPSGDTAGEVDKELKNIGVASVAWQPRYSLVSMIGTPEAQQEIDRKANQVLADMAAPVLYHDLQPGRSTYVVPEGASKQVLEKLYEGLKPYLA